MFFRNKFFLVITIALLLVGGLLLMMASSVNDYAAPEKPVPTTTSIGIPTSTPTLLPTKTVARTPTITATPEIPQGEAFVIGKSADGRPLEVHRFGKGPIRQMIIAGIHGGYESNTVKLADELITHLRENPAVVPIDRTLFILRLMNPDGYAREFGIQGRANANGVDLNRNWDANWQTDWPRAYCWNSAPITAGTAAMSEPETQAVAVFLREQAIHSLISIHSAGPVIFAGGEPDSPRSTSLGKALANASGYPYPGDPSLCVYTGMMADWADAQGIPAVDIELPDHSTTDFEKSLKTLQAFLSWE